MYIKYNDTAFHCRYKAGIEIHYIGLPDDFPFPVSGVIPLYADDGFLMIEDNTEKYMRQTFENGVLTLTNTLEPELVEPEEPTEPEPTTDEILNTLLGVK